MPLNTCLPCNLGLVCLIVIGLVRCCVSRAASLSFSSVFVPAVFRWYRGSRAVFLSWRRFFRFVCERGCRRAVLCVPRRECHFSARATRHTVDSAIDPVCPLGLAPVPVCTHTLYGMPDCLLCRCQSVFAPCVCVCDYCVMYIHSIHSSGSLTLSVPNEPKWIFFFLFLSH